MKKKRIFIFAYYSYFDPVFQSAVLPYFENLSERSDNSFVLLTFEQEKYRTNKKHRAEIKDYLKKHGIIWYNTNWHSGRFKALKKIFDFLWGMLLAVYITLRYRVKGIYSEGFPGAIFGHYLCMLFQIPHMIHTFEPHTEYMVEGGVWNDNSWEAKFLRYHETKMAQRASYIFTATNKMVDRLKEEFQSPAQIHRVPSCVDLDVFKFNETTRDSLRNKLQIKKEEIVIIYLGKFGGMYMDEEIFDFFKICHDHFPNTFRFILLTPDDYEFVYDQLKRTSLPNDIFHINTVGREEVPKYLSAADFGFVPVRQYPSKRYCSPIKDGEYWACGLPILIPVGVSDDYKFAADEDIGLLLKNTSNEAYLEVANGVVAWMENRVVNETRKRCRSFVERDRSVENYKKLYLDIFSKLP
ncbi:hypothetical protein QQ008_30050 [Fulvivirgaceae bacterium BMA10]|uniref:Glycosyltransferase n=1 Tax=Splendidivirga corallicola TaxID=3051826 RepID=A0ABT8L234_9BACT|nr:hypothetical protein [Fulvivirgaceae bacterium BMA10]